MKIFLLERTQVLTCIMFLFFSLSTYAKSISDKDKKVACETSSEMINQYKDNYKTLALKFNLTLGLIQGPVLKNVIEQSEKGGNKLRNVLPGLKSKKESLEKKLFQKDGDERLITKWILKKDLYDDLKDLDKALQKIMPLLNYFNNTESGISSVARELKAGNAILMSLDPLSPTLKSCNDYDKIQKTLPLLSALSSSTLPDALSKSAQLLQLVNDNTKEIIDLLNAILAAKKSGKDRLENFLGNDLQTTKNKVGVAWVVLAVPLYTVEWVKDKFGGEDRIRKFANVSEKNWGIFHSRSNSNDTAVELRKKVFPPLEELEDATNLVLDNFLDTYKDIPGLINDINSVSNSLATLNNSLLNNNLPSEANCRPCWFK